MGELKPITGLTKVATIAIWSYLALELAYVAASLIELLRAEYRAPDELRPMDLISIPYLLVTIICFFLVGRWIYVANWNAHQLSDEMTISPGWSVGWFFIPIANLFKPYQAMKECWIASHNQWNSYSDPPPPVIGWWWGLWIVTNILSNISMRMTMAQTDMSVAEPVLVLDLLVAALSVPLVMALASIMRRVSAAQLETNRAAVFA